MTNKENAIEIIRFRKPERIISRWPDYKIHYLGCNHEGYEGGGQDSPADSKWTDIWKTEWYKIQADIMGCVTANPLADINNLKSYKWPDPDDDRVCGKIYKMVKGFQDGDMFLSGVHRNTLWEKSYMLVGMENMMMYFYKEPEYVREILHKIMDFHLGIAAHYISLGIESARLGDDLGTQTGLILSPDIINEFCLPEYKRLFEFYKKHNVVINFHSCGHIEPILGMFMSLGVDILNPIQSTANNLSIVRQKTQGKMSLEGGISTKTLMEGSISEIKYEVRNTIKILGENGGYFCAPDQEMPFPEESYKAYKEALNEYGRYPLEAKGGG